MTDDEISELIGSVPEVIGGRRSWWLRNANQERHERARRAGLVAVRTVQQLRRPLPLEHELGDPDPAHLDPAAGLRSFDPERDAETWLALNKRAFAHHPDQGTWTRADLDERLRADWFDPRGFLVHVGPDGDMDGFCWTKIHRRTSTSIGEIYVIGIDPARNGTGLGRAMTLAGLSWMQEHGDVDVAMLYVESDNQPALRLYQSLGFIHHHDDIAYELPAAAGIS